MINPETNPHIQDDNSSANALHTSPFNIAVVASGLGFFVDAFDLFLFNVYRIPSLKELGLTGSELTQTGEFILSVQMVGMMLGGVLSGILGDKFGRVSVLFASIVLYSIANIANAMITDIDIYALIRFIAGVGLAGELGAGITLVSESMTVERRGYGTILVASLGALGAVTAGLVSDFLYWRTAFFVAGVLGLCLLLLRVKSMETTMFHRAKSERVLRGSFRTILRNHKILTKYLLCILMGVPIWYSVGLLITLTPEITALQNISGVKLSTCFILFQVGITLGDVSSGVLSQLFKSRKNILLSFMGFAVLSTIVHFYQIAGSSSLYVSSLAMGLGCGYLSVFVTATAEQFGTNIRVLVSATVTNFMRGAVTLLIPLRQFLSHSFGLSLISSLAVTGMIVWISALIATIILPDTYGKNLDYNEE
jgi:MFS transporter, putative metabolite:H+ symporter